ncbi:DUF456 domain-containing protein [Paenibacillus validus]|uniref:DUF456 family protein n=1 Tax=Paenibacillus validus TaxID=44253 RepID=A0A7X2ZA07_9BACL|nr:MULTISPECIES: DUF456 domain-containing protein [Paenibacillus]MED4604138.1 DUF456 domain-containing protein [Paenibacillus validus]MED4609471.1 DUF456 domain-containing protein [Paenibacillus validus]MUG71099.1 DUF456 family protein [Paenibacillus validus]
MVLAAWSIIVLLFVIGMAGAVYPILPGALAIYGAFFVYGFMLGFEPFGFWFWLIQTSIVAVLMIADYLVNALGVKKFGGNRASVIGSTIGLIAGPFVIPGVGLIVGPFLGAVLGELIVGTPWKQALRAGVGALVGFFSSLVVKFGFQLLMIALFVVWVVRYA